MHESFLWEIHRFWLFSKLNERGSETRSDLQIAAICAESWLLFEYFFSVYIWGSWQQSHILHKCFFWNMQLYWWEKRNRCWFWRAQKTCISCEDIHAKSERQPAALTCCLYSPPTNGIWQLPSHLFSVRFVLWSSECQGQPHSFRGNNTYRKCLVCTSSLCLHWGKGLASSLGSLHLLLFSPPCTYFLVAGRGQHSHHWFIGLTRLVFLGLYHSILLPACSCRMWCCPVFARQVTSDSVLRLQNFPVHTALLSCPDNSHAPRTATPSE